MNRDQLKENFNRIKNRTKGHEHVLVAVSKTKDVALIKDAYDLGQREFGENKVQEIVPKSENLPKDIKWHFIGHLQRNKVKFIVPFVHLIHSVDSLRLLKEINKQGVKISREIHCLLQVHIAVEESKFGFSESELEIIIGTELKELSNIKIRGLMGMATNTSDVNKVRSEFKNLKNHFNDLKLSYGSMLTDFDILSMGMSQDFEIALEEGSNMIRLGSTIFGAREK